MNIRELLIKVGFDGGNSTRELDNIDQKTEKVKRGFIDLGGVLAALFTGGALMKLAQTADTMQNLQAQIGNATGDLSTANAKFNELADHANTTRTSIDAYVGSWAKMNQGIKNFGGSTEDTTTFVDTLSAAFKVNGTEAASANAALFQLSQTMQSGVVQGEEMNSFLDAQGTLAQEVMTSIGGTVQGYKKMQAAGKVTAKMLMDAVNKQYPKYMDALRKMPMTMGDVWTIMSNDVKKGINTVNNSAQVIPRIAKGVMKAWDWIINKTKELSDALGGPDGLVLLLKNCAEAVGIVAGAFAAFKIASLLTNPASAAAAAVLLLAGAFVMLKNDFDVWQEGGISAIDWGYWIGEVKRLGDSFGLMGETVRNTGKELDTLKDFSLSNWSIKGEIESIATMFRQLSNTINDTVMTARAGFAGNLDAAKYYADRMMNPDRYYDKSGKRLDANGSGATIDVADQYYRDQLDGKKPAVIPQNAPTARQGWEDTPIAPGTAPGVAPQTTTNNTQTVTNNVNAPINIVAQPGQNAGDIGQEVANRLTELTKNAQNDALNLQMAGGAK